MYDCMSRFVSARCNIRSRTEETSCPQQTTFALWSSAAFAFKKVLQKSSVNCSGEQKSSQNNSFPVRTSSQQQISSTLPHFEPRQLLTSIYRCSESASPDLCKLSEQFVRARRAECTLTEEKWVKSAVIDLDATHIELQSEIPRFSTTWTCC